MYVYSDSREGLKTSTSAQALKSCLLVFDGEFSVPSDRTQIVDTMLGLWSLVLARKDDDNFGEVDLIYSKILELKRASVFPEEFCGDLPTLLEKEMRRRGIAGEGNTAEEASLVQLQERTHRVRRGSNIRMKPEDVATAATPSAASSNHASKAKVCAAGKTVIRQNQTSEARSESVIVEDESDRHLAEQSMREGYEEQLASLHAKLEETQRQLRQAKATSGSGATPLVAECWSLPADPGGARRRVGHPRRNP